MTRQIARSRRHNIGTRIKATLDDPLSSILRYLSEDSFLGGSNEEGLYSVGLVCVGSLVPWVSGAIEEPVKEKGRS